ncbi:MAG: hypothetical protein E3J87_10050 [Candidatus Cloacimonadota bacterium]|nr:MAG: hypothetical protein E3J87_10050 [Candidatus Cloacimonadota bacterium]
MKRYYAFAVLLFIFLLTFISAENAEEKKEAIAIVTSFKGSVHIERDGEEILPDAMIELFAGDEIETGDDGNIIILYTSGKFRSIGASSSIIIEPERGRGGGDETERKEVEEKESSDFEPLFAFKAAGERSKGRTTVRAVDTTGIFILEPGNSRILEAQPLFLWTSISDAEEYHLKLQRMGVSVGETTTGDTSLAYPDDWQPLEKEKSYVMEIEAKKAGKTIASKKALFRILSEEKKETLEKERQTINKNSPDEITAHLLLSELYKDYILNALAIEELKELISLAPDIPDFHFSLSEVYNVFGLIKESNRELDIYKKLKESE